MAVGGTTTNTFVYIFNPQYRGNQLRNATQDLTSFERGLLRIQRLATAAGFGLRRLGEGLTNYSQQIIRSGLQSARTFADYEQEIFRLERNTDLAGPAFDRLNKRMEQIANTSGMLIKDTKDIGINIAKTGILGTKIAEVNDIFAEMERTGDPDGSLGKKYNELSNNLITDFSALTKTLIKARLVLDNFTEADTDVLIRGFVAITDQNQPLEKINQQLLQYISLIDTAAKNANTNEKRIVQVAEKMNSVFKSGDVFASQESVIALSTTIAVLGEQSRTVSNNFTDFLVQIRKLGKQESFLKVFDETSKKWGLTADNFKEKVFESKEFAAIMVDVMNEYGKAMKEGKEKSVMIADFFPSLTTKVGGRLGIEFEKFKTFYETMREKLKEHEKAIESVEKTYDKQSKSTLADLNRLDNAWVLLSNDLSKIVIPIFRQFLTIIQENTGALKKWLADPQNQQKIREFIEMAPKLLIYGIVAGELLKLAGSAVLVISGIKNLVGGFTLLLAASKFLLPGGLLLVGLATITTILFPDLLATLPKIKDKFLDWIESIDIKEWAESAKKYFSDVFNDVKSFINELTDASRKIKEFKDAGGIEGAKKRIAEEANRGAAPGARISDNLVALRAQLEYEELINNYQAIIHEFFVKIRDKILWLVNIFFNFWVDVGLYVEKKCMEFQNYIVEKVSELLNWPGKQIDEAMEALRKTDFGQMLLNRIESMFAAIGQAFDDAIEYIKKWFNDWIVGDITGDPTNKRAPAKAGPSGKRGDRYYREIPEPDDLLNPDGTYRNLGRNNQTGGVIRRPSKMFGGRIGEARNEAIITPFDSSSSSAPMQQMLNNGSFQIQVVESNVYLDKELVGKQITKWQIKNAETYGNIPPIQLSGIGG